MVWRCRSADVKVWRCRSADVKVWRCRSADVRVWRCITTAAFLRRTLRRRSREKHADYFLRVIPSLTHYSDIVSIYWVYIYICIIMYLYSGILSDILSGIYSDTLSGIYSDNLSDILSGILSDIYSGILSGIFPGVLFWRSLCSGLAAAHSVRSSRWDSTTSWHRSGQEKSRGEEEGGGARVAPLLKSRDPHLPGNN